MIDDEAREIEIADQAALERLEAAGGGVTEAAPTPIELTEAALEALLFVAERPLTRREIAALAVTDRETVDARLGDLEVSLRARGIRLLVDGDRVELATSPEAGALVARYVGADAVRLSTASLETLAIVAYRQPVTKAAVERIRGVDSDYTIRSLLHRRLIAELGRSDAPGPPVPVRHRLRLPRALRADQPRGAAPARGRRRRPPGRGGRGAAAAPARGGQPHARRRDRRDRRRRLMPAERLQKVLASAGVASRRASEALIAEGRVTVDGKVAKVGDQVDPERSIITVDGRVIGGAGVHAYLLLHKPMGVASTTRDKHAPRTVLDLLPTALVPEGARLYPGRPARPGLRGDAPAHQRRRLVGAGPASAVRGRARVRDGPAHGAGRRPGRRRCAPGSRSRRGSPRSPTCGR